ncbi:MAG TPA: tRNA (adenosine(37)-N6)-threonylcarbamoyltransferase complex dimerization subunit type 1 TsaB [Dehalococcoidia bacterium]|jgi:tRNA threonylcarbamoyladenosine biosynthesis protein TsaB|nr:tRNA (adenosine(37)-N6)-threonylcarbamoyltransferase complex dimerization subunit type 1 TsaB [Dehalococcoidia bacterium]
MKILGIDTSGYANAIGVIDGDQILADLVFEARADSLEKIVANIDFALEKAGLTLEDIQGFGVGLGPGSWTGIRVGVTVGKVLAYGTGKPVCGVPTLEVLAYNAQGRGGLICPVISAGAGDTIYAALYRRKGGTVSRITEYYVGDVQGLSQILKEPAILVGTGVEAYRQRLKQALGSPDVEIEMKEDVPRGAAVALLAAARLERGQSDDVLSLTPLYLREFAARAMVNRYAQAKGKA